MKVGTKDLILFKGVFVILALEKNNKENTMVYYGYESLGRAKDLLGVKSKTLIEVSFWKYLYLLLFGYRTKVIRKPL